MPRTYLRGVRPILVLAVACLVLSGCLAPGQRAPYRFYIPNDYVGWVQVDFEVQGAAPLATQDGYRLVRFSASGRFGTSSPMESGWAHDEFYAYGSSGESRLSDAEQTGSINAGATGLDGSVHFWRFFVGPYDDYMKYGYPNAARPTIGPVAR